MATKVVSNDVVLTPFLMSQDPAESQRQLALLLTEHAEAPIRAVVWKRLSFYLSTQEHHPDYEDLCSEVRTKVLAYLWDLKANLKTTPCKDLAGYVRALANNACNDYLRQRFPVRAKLHKKVRDLLRAHPDFALWEQDDQNRVEWLCGFKSWRGRCTSSASQTWLRNFNNQVEARIESLARGNDVQCVHLSHLLALIFKEVGEPIALTDLVDVVSEIKGIKDEPSASLDADAAGLSSQLPDARLRIDTVLEMREPLERVWRELRALPRDEFMVYLLGARNTSDEALIHLFLAAKIATEKEVAALLNMTINRFRDFRDNRLPLDNETIRRELGVTIERVYKLRLKVGKRLDSILAEVIPRKKCPRAGRSE